MPMNSVRGYTTSDLQSPSELEGSGSEFSNQATQTDQTKANRSQIDDKSSTNSDDLLNSQAIYLAQRPGASFVLDSQASTEVGIQYLGSNLFKCFDTFDLGNVNHLVEQANTAGFITQKQADDIKYFFSLQFANTYLQRHSQDLGITVPESGLAYTNMTEADVNTAVNKGYINQQEANDLLKYGTVGSPIDPSSI